MALSGLKQGYEIGFMKYNFKNNQFYVINTDAQYDQQRGLIFLKSVLILAFKNSFKEQLDGNTPIPWSYGIHK